MSETTNTSVAHDDPFTPLFPNPSPQLQTCITHLRGFMKQDIDHHLSGVTDDFKCQWVTHGFDSLGPRLKDRDYMEKLMGTFWEHKSITNIRHEPIDYIEMPGKVMIHTRTTAEFKTVHYDDDQIWIFHLTSDPDPKIYFIKWVFDSHYATRILNDLHDILKDVGFEVPN